ncbi:MAG: SprT-like domain-containing protein [Bdellovibrionales bacterium]|nr:SprT-like domain-containing protein [Bdellovibrionales bacterium]
MSRIDLEQVFFDWNRTGFKSALPMPTLRWNSRLSTTAGRFIPDRREPVIEVAEYLLELENAEELVRDTIGHEMIHYWLWMKRRPYGHNAEFYKKMEELGVSRYNPVPRHRPFKHCYICLECDQRIWVRKRLKGAACAACCNQYADGRYDSRYKLKLAETAENPAVDLEVPA